MPDGIEEKIISFIDLGTNSVRLLIVRLNRNRSYSILRRQKDMIRLGEGSFARGVISEEAIERAVIICRKYVEISESFGAVETVVVATSAARDAKNGHALICRLREEAGLDVKIISGEEEARLIYLGISNGVSIGEKLCIFIDIGGGSTEISIGDQRDYVYLKSLKIGALRTYYRFLGDAGDGPIEEKKLGEIYRHVRSKIAHSKRDVLSRRIERAYGSSGTILSLIAVAKNMRSSQEETNGEDYIDLAEIEKIVKMLTSMTAEERKKVPGLNPSRADISTVGAIILHIIMKDMKIGRVYATDRSLRDGLLFDYLFRHPAFSYTSTMPVRDRSVRQFGKSCRIDEEHADKVMKLSRELFLSAKACGLHDYSDEELELLEYAAYLHDVGQFISFSRHQNHSHYVITNAPLLGFNQSELETIGLITRFHRKKVPKARDPVFGDSDTKTVELVTVLSLFLRIAEHLERSHDGRVEKAYFSRDDDGCLTLNVLSKKDCAIEVWAVEEDLAIVEKVFGTRAVMTCSVPGSP